MSQTKTGLVYPERRELVLVEAEGEDRWSALRDALSGKQHRKDIRGLAKSMPQKENEWSSNQAGQRWSMHQPTTQKEGDRTIMVLMIGVRVNQLMELR